MNIQNLSFDEIYRTYYERIQAYCLAKTHDRDDATTIANDTFILFYQKQDSLSFEDDADLYSWLVEVAKRKTWEYFRQNSYRLMEESLELHENTLIDPDNSLTTPTLQNKLYEQALRRIKERLSQKDAPIFDLLVIQGMKQEDAASTLGMNLGTLKMRWHRMKPRIQTIIEEIKRDGQL